MIITHGREAFKWIIYTAKKEGDRYKLGLDIE